MMHSSTFVGLTSAGATSSEMPRTDRLGRFFEMSVRTPFIAAALLAMVCMAVNDLCLLSAVESQPEIVEPLSAPTLPVAVTPHLVTAKPAWVPVIGPPAPPAPPLPKLKKGQEIYHNCVGRWVDVVATGYSPHDPIDGDYHATKGEWRWITADGETNVLEEPYGVAVPNKRGKPSWVKYGTKLIIPTESGYLRGRSNRMFVADDTGSTISNRTRSTGIVHIDVRFKTTASAMKYGTKKIRVFIVDAELEGE